MTPSAHSTKCLIAAAIASAGVGTAAHAAIGDINSIALETYFLQAGQAVTDFPNTTLTVVDNELLGFSVTEADFVDDGQEGNFTNRHLGYLSADNTTPYEFQNNEGFDLSFDMEINAVEPIPAKEGGLWVESLGGLGQFIAKTGSGEVASFGNPFPFTSSTAGAVEDREYDGLIYSPGTTVNMRLIYTPGDGAANTVSATAEMIVNGFSAGAREITNTENGIIDGTTIALYAQMPPDILFALDNTASVAYSNISITALSAGILGDYNDSGQVEQGDLDLVLQNWGLDTDANGVPTGWTNDLPSGQIEQTELDGVLQNWGNTAAPDFSGSSVPEPATLAVLGGLGLIALRRRA